MNNPPADIMQHIYKLSGMKGDEDDEYDDEETRANTRANAASSNSKLNGDRDGDGELEEESDATSHSASESDATESVSTGLDDDDATATATTDTDTDNDFSDIEDPVETPAMLAKKVATAASTVANSDAKKKATIASKRAIASSKPPKGKATLQDITTLQNSYDDIAHEEGDDHGDDSADNNDDSDDDTNYLRKFETEMHENYIASCHQEMLHLNNSEVNALARVVRNNDGAIIDVMHKTMPILTKYEKTRILGQRAKQLNQGAQPMVPVDKKIIDGYLIAQLELQQKALPFIIRRPLPGGKSEYWRVSDLEII
jgi:DNA-directed RNA polymerase I, II, and III subunit RPABC2